VVRIAEFGAFVEIFPGTDGLLHVRRLRSTASKSEGRTARGRPDPGEGALDRGNRIKLSRKAVLREQRAKLGLPEAGEDGGQGGGGAAEDSPKLLPGLRCSR